MTSNVRVATSLDGAVLNADQCLRRELQRPTAGRMPERQLVHEFERCAAKDRNLAAGLQPTTTAQFVELSAACGVCQDSSGDAGMSGRFKERGCEAGAQTPPLLRASSPL